MSQTPMFQFCERMFDAFIEELQAWLNQLADQHLKEDPAYPETLLVFNGLLSLLGRWEDGNFIRKEFREKLVSLFTKYNKEKIGPHAFIGIEGYLDNSEAAA